MIRFTALSSPLRGILYSLSLAFGVGLLCNGNVLVQSLHAGVVEASSSSAIEAALPDAPSTELGAGYAGGGNSAAVPLQDQQHPVPTVKGMPKRVFLDGVHALISPTYLRTGDLKWILPLAGATAASLATDTRTMTQVVTRNASFNETAGNVSDGMRDGFIALPAAMFLVGQVHGNEHARETGLLGLEAIGDAYAIDEVVKLASFRERPLLDNGRGNFYVGSTGLDSSFVSGHSMAAWSSAAVIAGEYKSKWVQAAAYTAATGVSLSRVLAQQHFPTDVLLGSVGGWLMGHYVFRAHHHWRREKQ